ncbi:DUF4251 domain-containing protein [Psychroflexus sp. CAK8W]|uniref:DUF4251 domain-containing protein n=1 Tax=Psychroflexus longus TaxID=2873596 RepID=A0ABS7XK71_9FLAO|nr:DUF4251 domain-containing protein [Psychroflexus longus]MBZ9779370.1 DUF4251 domain-containing protein [Psychroflexus longus]
MKVKLSNQIKIKSLVILLLSFIIASCGISRDATAEENERLEQLLQDKYFEFDLRFARPLPTNSLTQLANAGLFRPGDNASQINLQGSSAVFKFEGDTVTANLPFFGERQFGGGYNSNTGIEFKGIPKDLKITKYDKKDHYQVNFNIREDSESYQVNLTIYPSLKGTININSSQRFPMRYEGSVNILKVPKEE